MATRYQFVDDSGETRLAGFLVPEPGGSSAAFYAAVAVFANSPSTLGAYEKGVLDATDAFNDPLVAVNVLQTLTAGSGNGFGATLEAPTFSAGTVLVGSNAAQIVVVNAAGTEKLALNLNAELDFTTGESKNPDFTAWTEAERIGADLVVHGQSVDSAAGGQFMAQIYCVFSTDSLAA